MFFFHLLDDLGQDCSTSIANALETLHTYTKPSNCTRLKNVSYPFYLIRCVLFAAVDACTYVDVGLSSGGYIDYPMSGYYPA